jgi:hypothetical protein
MNWKEAINSGENGIYCWFLDEKLPTQFSYEEMEVDLISEDSITKNDICRFDLQTIEVILKKTDDYIIQAIDYIKDCIRKSPKQFLLTEEEMDRCLKQAEKNKYIQVPDNNIEKYLSLSASDFPVSMPNIIFYPDKTWMIRFVESKLPTVNYGHGIGVFFNEKNEITKLEIFPEE